MAKTGPVGKRGRELARTVSFSVKPSLYRDMSDYLSERGCSRSWFLNKALESYLAECAEDKADYEAAVAAWKEFEAGGEKGTTLSEFKKDLGL